MTAASTIRALAMIGTLSGLILTVSGLRRNPNAADRRRPPARSPVADQRQPVPAVRPDSLARAIANQNPFRADRGTSRVAFDPAAVGVAVPPPVAPPTLVLIGVVGGEGSRAAVIRGIPGTDGARVLGGGEHAGGYTVRAVFDDSAYVMGPDSLLRLRLRRGPS